MTIITANRGLNFFLPDSVEDKDVSVIEVGTFNELTLAQEINKFLDTKINNLTRINSYLLVHEPRLEGLETLLKKLKSTE